MSIPPPRLRGGHRTVRVPAGVGCLVALVALPLAVLAALVTVARALLRPARRPFAGGSDAPGGIAPAAATDLCDFVVKMSLDDDFDLDDARTAGLPLDRGVTAESLVGEGLARGWIERRGERFAVTARGRAESERHLRRGGL